MKKSVILFYWVTPVIFLSTVFYFLNSELLRFIGNAALVLFSITLFVKPLSIVLKNKYLIGLMTYRRSLGVTTFFLYVTHSLGLIALYQIDYLSSIFNFNYLSWGIFAGLFISMMALTSNDYSLAKLKHNWKKLHTLAYPAYYLVLLHSALAKNDFVISTVLGASYAALRYLQYKKTNKWL